ITRIEVSAIDAMVRKIVIDTRHELVLMLIIRQVVIGDSGRSGSGWEQRKYLGAGGREKTRGNLIAGKRDAGERVHELTRNGRKISGTLGRGRNDGRVSIRHVAHLCTLIRAEEEEFVLPNGPAEA